MAALDGFEMESNVARDVLSTANSFGNLPKVIAEYVTNSVDAGEHGQALNVTISKRRSHGGGTRLVISDDARGMDDTDLRRFFFMHAENEDRRRGRRTRGRFGTGKAAAFGIGSSLQVETRRNGRKWVVRLEKDELETATDERRKPKPDVQIDGMPTKEPNGTSIVIDGITKPIEEPRIARELRRCLGRQLDVCKVTLFGGPVQYVEPTAAHTWPSFRSAGHPVAAVIGDDVICTIKAAAKAVDEGMRGVIVMANYFPVAQIEATGDYAARIFGYCDVPALEKDHSTPGPYTDARDLRLNEDNRTAGPLADWLRECLATVTRELAAEERVPRPNAKDDALRRAASKMEAVLNRHYQDEFHRARTQADSNGKRSTTVTEDPDGQLVRPNEDGVAGYERGPGGEGQAFDRRDESGEPKQKTTAEVRPRKHDPFGEGRGDSVRAKPRRPRQRSRPGGFKIEWQKVGSEAPRSSYIESELTIIINLDHPEIAAAYAAGDQSPLFRMLVFEAAAQEYCYATAYQELGEDPLMDGSDILQYVRDTINLLTRDIAEVVADLTWMSAPASAAG